MTNAKPKPMPVKADNVPNELKELDRWVCWSWEWNGKKFDKKPRQVDGTLAKSNDPQTWNSFAQVLAAHQAGHFDGIGFVLGEHNGVRYVGIDLDDHVVDGVLDEDAQFVVKHVQTYGEISPSGNGIKVIARGGVIEGKKVDNKNGYEFYDGGRYFTVTGNKLEGSPAEIRDCESEVQFAHYALIPYEHDAERKAYDGDERQLAISALNGLKPARADGYDDWIRVGMALRSVSDDLLPEWEKWSQQSDKFEADECGKKWESFSSGRGLTVGTLVWMAKQDGWEPSAILKTDDDHIAFLRKKLRLPELKTVAKAGREKGVYEFVLTDDRRLELGTANQILTMRTVEAVILDAIGRCIPPNKKQWRQIAASICSLGLSNVIEIDSKESVWEDRLNFYLDHIGEHSLMATPYKTSNDVDARSVLLAKKVSLNQPFILDGNLHIHANHFLQHLRFECQDVKNQQEVATTLARMGFESRQIKRANGGQQFNRRYWVKAWKKSSSA